MQKKNIAEKAEMIKDNFISLADFVLLNSNSSGGFLKPRLLLFFFFLHSVLTSSQQCSLKNLCGSLKS